MTLPPFLLSYYPSPFTLCFVSLPLYQIRDLSLSPFSVCLFIYKYCFSFQYNFVSLMLLFTCEVSPVLLPCIPPSLYILIIFVCSIQLFLFSFSLFLYHQSEDACILVFWTFSFHFCFTFVFFVCCCLFLVIGVCLQREITSVTCSVSLLAQGLRMPIMSLCLNEVTIRHGWP